MRLVEIVKSGDQDSDEAIDLYIKIASEITEKSVDWYWSEPKSEPMKAMFKEMEQKVEKETESLERERKELVAERDRVVAEAKAGVSKWQKANKAIWSAMGIYTPPFDAVEKAYKKFDKQYGERLKELGREIGKIEDRVRRERDEKMVHLVLTDLGFADTEENRQAILDTEVLFWD